MQNQAERLQKAIAAYRDAYVRKYTDPATGQVRADAPLRKEVSALLDAVKAG